MYKDFYGLKEKPFSLTPDPRFLYLSESHRFALEHLIYGITQREGFMMITGDVGTGKTTICRALLERLDKQIKTALILNPQMSEKELLLSIISEFGIAFSSESKKEIVDRLNEFLLQQLASGGSAVLIIDEAQNLSLPVLEQIRLLSNLETEKEKLLQIVLVGQPELRNKVNLPALRQLNQRISVRYSLRPLTRKETKKYIEHRLMVAGSEGNIDFSRWAISLIFRYSRGTPRLINLISDRALLGGFSKQTYSITQGIVKGAAKSLGDEEVLSGKKISIKGYGYGIIVFLVALTLFVVAQREMNLKFPYLMSISKPNVSNISQAPNNKRPKVVPATNSKKDFSPKKEVVSSPVQVSAVVSKSAISANVSKALLPKKEVVSSPNQVSAVVSKSAISTNASEASKNKEVQETSPLLPKSLAKKKITKGTSQIPGAIKTESAYTIYLRSYPDKELALSIAKRLTRLGYEIYISRVNIPGMGTQYRVLLGSFKDRETPWKVMEGLKKNGDLKEFPNAVIEKASDAMGKPL